MNTKTFFPHFKNLIVLLFCIPMLTSCIKCFFPPAPDTLVQDVEAYAGRDALPEADPNEKFGAYFDFSGIYYAFNQEGPKESFEGITQKITSNTDKFNIYTLANDKVSDVTIPSGADATGIYNTLKDSNNAGQFYAPIAKALASITEKGIPALLVTDYEEYSTNNVIEQQAYAAQYFKKWISEGKEIIFFVIDYVEPTKGGQLNKHLYYTVFDDGHHTLLSMIEEALEGRNCNITKFTLSPTSYKMFTDYKKNNMGGCYHDETGYDVVSSTNEDSSEGPAFTKFESYSSELYPLGEKSWKDILYNAKDQTKENGARPPFDHYLDSLYINLTDMNSYDITTIDVEVLDVQKDFDKYTAWTIAKKNPPTASKEDGNTFYDIPDVSADYYDENTGKILDEYDWEKSKGEIYTISDMFTFNQDLFDKTKEKTKGKKVELAIDFDGRFTGELKGNQTTYDDADMLQINVKIGSVKIKDQQLEKLFKWQGNRSLYESVLNTLQESKPIGKVLYTYYLKIN